MDIELLYLALSEEIQKTVSFRIKSDSSTFSRLHVRFHCDRNTQPLPQNLLQHAEKTQQKRI